MEGRYVVVDLNKGAEDVAKVLSPADFVVIPLVMLCDILKSPDRQARQMGFERFLEAHRQRLCVARGVAGIEEVELARMSPICGLSHIDWRNTRLLRESDGPLNWDALTVDRGWYEECQKFRREFIEVSREVCRLLKDGDPDFAKQLRSNKAHCADKIREPFIGSVIPQARNAAYQTDVWRKRLDLFPDEYAVGRMSRLYVWYGFHFVSSGSSRKFQNNFDDAAYAFAASYSGYLFTGDMGLRACVKAIFPHVTLL
jgi:hypothetical protein